MSQTDLQDQRRGASAGNRDAASAVCLFVTAFRERYFQVDFLTCISHKEFNTEDAENAEKTICLKFIWPEPAAIDLSF